MSVGRQGRGGVGRGGHERSRALRGVSLRDRTTFKIGGAAEAWYEPRSLEELLAAAEKLARSGVSPFVLGGGSNTLFPDGTFERPVISLGRLRGFALEGRRLVAEAGTPLAALVGASSRAGLCGLDVLSGIPGTIGGAVRMNAGGRHGELGPLVRRIWWVPPGGGLEELDGRSLPWRYRNAGLPEGIVARVELELTPEASTGAASRRAQEVLTDKARTQPLGARSAGCVFRNPPGESAGRLIELAGLRGRRCGGAQVSEIHANFVVNESGARAADVLELIEVVRARVEERFGIPLECEVVLAR